MMSCARTTVAALAVLACLAPPPGAAQVTRTVVPLAGEHPPVPRFDIAPSPISLVYDVRPGEYLGITGPRSAWLGTETGEGELWVHPLKVARAFQIDFQTPEYRDPVRGRDVARRIEVRPEATTITYSHMTFTVRQHILAPRDAAGLLVLLDVETFIPLELVVHFQPVLQYMWPSSFGGQYVFWDDAHDAFVLSESVQRRNAVVGTSWPAHGEAHPAHQLAEAPATFVVPVDSARATREFIPIAIAAGTADRDSVFAIYARLLADAEAVYRDNRAWADSVLGSTTSIETPDHELDLALEWAKINLEEQRVCNPTLGCGLVAGWGISGAASTRPGFGWFFGGDAAINSLAMDAVGQWELVAEDLRFLARYQRADGKIPHEISQAASYTDWFEGYPYPYYHADTTPYWMLALWEYWRASGDDATVTELWDAYVKAWEWCLSAETDGDGIIENTVGGYGAIEVGGLGEDLHQDIYLAAVWIQALEATRHLAGHMGDSGLASRATAIRETALATLNEAYWRAENDQHAFGILQSGGTNDNLTAWPGTALSFGLLEPERAERTLRKLATDSISSDWGARLLSVGSDLYEPLHYNNGAVWPFMTGFVAWGQYAYRRPWAGQHLVDAVKQHTFLWSRGRHPENFSGAFNRPMDATVPHQFFATSMLVTPLVRGMLGWAPDAPAGRATLAPQLPPDWDRVVARRLLAGGSALDVELVRSPTRAETRVRPAGPPLELEVLTAVPAGARSVRVQVDGQALEADVRVESHDQVVRVVLELDQTERTVVVAWEGGLQVVAPGYTLEPGQRSRGLRVVDVRFDDSGWALTLEGEPGRAYELTLVGEPVRVERGPATLSGRDATAGRTLLDVRLDGDGGRAAAVVRLVPDGR
jgi:glycogen debranching enzyme